MAVHTRYELGVGLLLVVAAAVLGLMALQLGALDRMGDRVLLTVEFSDVNGLTEGAVVAVAGVRVGEVEQLHIVHDRALVTLAVRPEAGVRQDARARVRARSMLGEKFVAIEPVSRDAPIAVDGDPLSSAGDQVEMDQVMSSVAPVMASLDPEVLSSSLKALNDVMARDPERLARMVENADTILENAARASESLPQLAADTQLTLAKARASLAGVDARVARLDPLLNAGDRLTPEAEAALLEIHALAADSRALVGDVRENTDEIETVLTQLSGFSLKELERLIREEGVLVRLRPRKPSSDDSSASK